MSQETTQWLNANTLAGYTSKRGSAWHYRADLQSDQPNHYPGPVPVEDVRRRLFGWAAESREVYVRKPGRDALDIRELLAQPDRDATLAYVLDALGLQHQLGRQAITRSDNDHVMGIFTNGYEPHPYDEWLLTTVANILDDDLHIGSAGLLRGGAVAWVSVEMEDNIKLPEGVEFRPFLLATTSFDGSLSTTFGRKVTNVICDNTHGIAMSERGQQIKIRHSRYSKLKLTEARQALNVIHEITSDFAAEVTRLCSIDVSDAAWAAFLDAHAPLPEAAGRGRAMAERKRETLTRLYDRDQRVAPWRGTGWGVLQAVNTYTHHEGIVRGAARAERNMLNAVTGRTDDLDQQTLDTLAGVLGRPLALQAA
jgi:phage/plasmid-like protein (TIGR03299 family)